MCIRDRVRATRTHAPILDDLARMLRLCVWLLLSGTSVPGDSLSTQPSLKATWQLDGAQTTEELTYLVTVCKDTELAAVNQYARRTSRQPAFHSQQLHTNVQGTPARRLAARRLLDMPPFNMDLATMVLSVPDSETRKLLALIVETAMAGLKRHGLPPFVAKLVQAGAMSSAGVTPGAARDHAQGQGQPPSDLNRQYSGRI